MDMDIEHSYDQIFRYLYYRLHDREKAEDLTQETFLRFLASSYEERGKQMNYLYSIARNLCIDEARKEREVPIPEELSDEGGGEERMTARIQFWTAFYQLSSPDRDILILRYVNQEPMGLIAQYSGLSRFALYRRIHRIKRQLENLLEDGPGTG